MTTRFAASIIEPILYMGVSRREDYEIYRIDCTLEDEEFQTLVYEADHRIDTSDYDDGISEMTLLESENERILKVILTGEGHVRQVDIYDLDRDQINNSWFETLDYDSDIEFNPIGSHFIQAYAQESAKIVIRHIDQTYKQLASLKKTSKYLQQSIFYQKFPKMAIYDHKWLDNDILALSLVFYGPKTNEGAEKNTFKFLLISVTKRAIIGELHMHILSAYKLNNYIIAISAGDTKIFRITPNIILDRTFVANESEKKIFRDRRR
eukprot:TRINITY_DN9598_c0_g1_i1.p1 TRINITY_DN9598_c0_g1~~TRINITY_DN9598_c0_g1_i1.p1  ORF type:complete len:300 (+),score=7.48 TRINITY_DN9598_c0_g1_i1:107-901(+)